MVSVLAGFHRTSERLIFISWFVLSPVENDRPTSTVTLHGLPGAFPPTTAPTNLRPKIMSKDLSWQERVKKRRPDLVRIVRLIEYEFTSRWADWSRRLGLGGWNRVRKLKGKKKLSLNIASGGTRHVGWLNVDVIRHADIRADLRLSIPLEDGSVSRIFCEHFVDHLLFPSGIERFLSECHRVLEIGGKARFILHDAEDLLKAYCKNDARYFQLAERENECHIEAVNLIFHYNGFHNFIYDFPMFESVLRQAGFKNISKKQYMNSDTPELLLDFQHPSREILSMYVEVTR